MYFRIFFILVWSFVSCAVIYEGRLVLAQQTCSVRDIIKMVERGDSRREIRRECSNVDVQRCSLTEVIRMAEDEKTSRQIYKKCRRSE